MERVKWNESISKASILVNTLTYTSCLNITLLYRNDTHLHDTEWNLPDGICKMDYRREISDEFMSNISRLQLGECNTVLYETYT